MKMKNHLILMMKIKIKKYKLKVCLFLEKFLLNKVIKITKKMKWINHNKKNKFVYLLKI